MLPPQLRHGMSPSQARLGLTTTRVPVVCVSLTANKAVSARQVREFSWFRRGRNWDSHLDAEFQHYHRRRYLRDRAQLRDAIKRCYRWDKPIPIVRPWSFRAASHWSRSGKRWQLENETKKDENTEGERKHDYELSESEKKWRRKMEAMEQYIQSNPYRAIFGKPFDPFWSPSMWAPLLPSWLRPETESHRSSEAKNEPDHVRPSKEHDAKLDEKRPTKSQDQCSEPNKPRQPYAETSSFSVRTKQSPGHSPVIEASASSWNSNDNVTTRLKYDPISNRMVPVEDDKSKSQPIANSVAPAQTASVKDTSKDTAETTRTAIPIPVKTFDSTRHEYRTAPPLSKLPENDIDLLSADRVRAAMGKRTHAQQLDEQSKQAQAAALERDYNEKSQALEQGLEETRQTLIEMRQRHQSQGQSETAAKSQESPATSRLQLAIDRMRMEKEILRPATSRLQLAIDRMRAHKDTRKAPTPNAAKDSNEISLADETSCGESIFSETNLAIQEVLQKSAEPDVYSNEPMGLQTAYIREKQECASGDKMPLDKELEEEQLRSPKLDPKHDDGYSKSPSGLETSYAAERQACAKGEAQPLEQELDPSRQEVEEVNDGYTKSPIGLEESYAQERQACAKGEAEPLEEELGLQRQEAADIDDGFTRAPIGLQKSYGDERQACISGEAQPLEHELDPLKNKEIEIDDGYTKAPMGMQKSYAEERQADANEQRTTMEQQEDPRVQSRQDLVDQADPYDTAPCGLQMSYKAELEASANGVAPRLDQELRGKNAMSSLMGTENKDPSSSLGRVRDVYSNGRKISRERDDGLVPKAYKDHATQSPVGLQFLFDKDQQQIKSDKGQTISAEQDIKVKRVNAAQTKLQSEVDSLKWSMSAHEGKWAHHLGKTSGKRFELQNSEIQKPQVQTPLPAIQAEGDMCPNVTKYTDGNKWYKQTNEQRKELAAIKEALGKDKLERDIDEICEQNSLYRSNGRSPPKVQRQKSIHQPDKRLGSAFEDTSKPAMKEKPEISTAVNPIDGTTRLSHAIPTGNFASPTGFINYDSVIDAEPSLSKNSSSSTHTPTTPYTSAKSTRSSDQRDESISISFDNRPNGIWMGSDDLNADPSLQINAADHDHNNVDWRHYPRVKRLEPHFTGRQLNKRDKKMLRKQGAFVDKRGQWWVVEGQGDLAGSAGSAGSAAGGGGRGARNLAVDNDGVGAIRGSAAGGWHGGGGGGGDESRDARRAYREGRKGRRGRQWGARLRWALSVGAATAGSVYAIGVGAELARGRREEERLKKVLAVEDAEDRKVD